jgi:hypothetical protein
VNRWDPSGLCWGWNLVCDAGQAYNDTNNALNQAWDATGSQLLHGNWSPSQLTSPSDWSASLNWANRSIDPVYAIYHSYNLIWQAGESGCGWSSLLGLLPAALLSDVSLAAPEGEEAAVGADATESAINKVISETTAASGNLTSSSTLTAAEALEAGEEWVGPGYKEVGKPGSGVFQSADGSRQFRIDPTSIAGQHAPGVPHFHLELLGPGGRPIVNNHIPFVDGP